MPPRIEYKASVEKDLRKLGKAAAVRVLSAIETALKEGAQPGTPLTGEFAGLRRLRVGHYRVIFVPTDVGYLVLRIAHRRDVYRRGRPRH